MTRSRQRSTYGVPRVRRCPVRVVCGTCVLRLRATPGGSIVAFGGFPPLMCCIRTTPPPPAMPDRLPDAELERIYDATIADLYRYVSRRCGGRRELAEDVTQEAWLRAIRE